LPQPLFIAFEGIDGSGTTTQCSFLQQHIRERFDCTVVATREPGGTPTAERIRDLVLDPGLEDLNPLTELLLYAASRAQHVRELIRPALQSGTPVLCDRFAASTVAYQGFGRGLDLQIVDQVNNIAVGDCQPDLTIYLDLPVAEAQARCAHRGAQRDRLEMSGVELQERVRAAYLELAAKNAAASLLTDGQPPVAKVAATILAALHQRWPDFPFKSGESTG
jgi:dTMP kinase